MKIRIDYEFCNWNDYILAERGYKGKYVANGIKQNEKKAVCLLVKEKYTGNYPITLVIQPHFKDKRRDLDNYRLKGLIDGLVTAGVIKNDNLTCIDKIIISPIFDNLGGVDIEIKESRHEEE